MFPTSRKEAEDQQWTRAGAGCTREAYLSPCANFIAKFNNQAQDGAATRAEHRAYFLLLSGGHYQALHHVPHLFECGPDYGIWEAVDASAVWRGNHIEHERTLCNIFKATGLNLTSDLGSHNIGLRHGTGEPVFYDLGATYL